MIVLGIETSCDETAVAVLKVGKQIKILSNLIASQHEIHAPYGGIFPELASRRHIEVLKPLVQDALKEAGVSQKKIEGVAVTNSPGLVGALLVGLSFAKAYAFGLGIPFIGVNHLEGHLNAPFLDNPKIRYPHVAMIVSGGHTALYFVKKFGEYQFLGGTRDDAAGVSKRHPSTIRNSTTAESTLGGGVNAPGGSRMTIRFSENSWENTERIP